MNRHPLAVLLALSCALFRVKSIITTNAPKGSNDVMAAVTKVKSFISVKVISTLL